MPTGYLVDDSIGAYVLQLDRPPDVGSSETAQLVVPFIARPAVLTSSGDQLFTVGSNVRTDLSPFFMAPVHYAAHQLEKLRGDDAASDRQFAKFLAYVQRYTEKVRKRGGTFVTLARNYLASPRRGGRVEDYARWP